MSTAAADTQLDRIETHLAEIRREVTELGRMRQEVDDLKKDLTLVAKDAMGAACQELEGVAHLTRDGEFLALARNVLRNTGNFNYLLNQLDSGMDFLKDATPVAREAFQDLVHVLQDLDSRGYFAFLPEFLFLLDNLVKCFSPQDLHQLAENLPAILRTTRNLTQPEMLKAVDNAALIFQNLDPTTVQETSIFRVIREINTPEMRRALGLAITFLKRISQQQFEATAPKQPDQAIAETNPE